MAAQPCQVCSSQLMSASRSCGITTSLQPFESDTLNPAHRNLQHQFTYCNTLRSSLSLISVIHPTIIMSTPSLASLPQELTDKITSQLEPRVDLSNLSMTCKAIRAATVRSVFGEIIMIWKGYNDHTRKVECPRVDLLLRTLLEAPELANYVSRLDFEAIGHRQSCHNKLKPQLPGLVITTSYAARVKKALQRMGLDQTNMGEKMEAKILDNDFDAVIALVVLLCPKITSLSLGLDVLIRNSYLSTVLKYALPTKISMQITRFQLVQVLKIGTSDPHEDTVIFSAMWPRKLPNNILKLEAYIPLFYLPNLQHLEMSLPDLAINEQFAWPTSIPPKLLTLTSLLLLECSVAPDVLSHIFPSTPSLKRLEYDCWMFHDDGFDASAFATALHAIKDTLTELKMTIQFWSSETVQPSELDQIWVEGTCSLSDMTALETLSIPSCVILGWSYQSPPTLAESLPSSVVSVQIRADCWWYDGYEWNEEQLMLPLRAFLTDGQWKVSAP
jgi:hypothetical protein